MSAVKVRTLLLVYLPFWVKKKKTKKIFLGNERNSQAKRKGKQSQLCSWPPPAGSRDICLFARKLISRLESIFGT